jgi:cytochrome c oxidase subunit 2
MAATTGGEGAAAVTPVAAGGELFDRLGCRTCHGGQTGALGPALAGVPGKTVELQGGTKVTADDAYLRESILTPQAKIVAGFQPVMPTFKGQLSEEQVMQLIAYIKSLGGGPSGTEGVAAVPAAQGS